MGSRSSHTIILFDPAVKLGSDDEHDPAVAVEFLRSLGKAPAPVGEDYLENSYRIPDNETWVGAYPNGLIVSSFDVANSVVSNDKFAKKLLAAHPRAQVTGVALHSVSNFFAFARYESGVLVRARAGGDGEEYMNEGTPDPSLEPAATTEPDYDDDPFTDGEPAALAYFDSCFVPEVAREESFYGLRMGKYRWKPYGFWARVFG